MELRPVVWSPKEVRLQVGEFRRNRVGSLLAIAFSVVLAATFLLKGNGADYRGLQYIATAIIATTLIPKPKKSNSIETRFESGHYRVVRRDLLNGQLIQESLRELWWNEMVDVRDEDRHVALVAEKGEPLIIRNEAFADPAARMEFLAMARERVSSAFR